MPPSHMSHAGLQALAMRRVQKGNRKKRGVAPSLTDRARERTDNTMENMVGAAEVSDAITSTFFKQVWIMFTLIPIEPLPTGSQPAV